VPIDKPGRADIFRVLYAAVYVGPTIGSVPALMEPVGKEACK